MTSEKLAWHRENGRLLDPRFDRLAVIGDKRKEKEELAKIEKTALDAVDLNQTEIGFVKFLFKIRNANFYKKTVPYERLFTSNPDSNRKRERVFIAGKIFPVLNIFYSGDDANPKDENIQLKIIKSAVKEFPKIKKLNEIYSNKYISIDNDKIRILLPKNYSSIDFGIILRDFLINGNLTKHTIGGEFPDYDTYKLALRDNAQPEDKWEGKDGSWLTYDRENNNSTWRNGYSHIIKNKIQGRLAPFKQIYDFYNGVDRWQFLLGHRVKWCIGAKELVLALAESPIIFGGQEAGSMAIYNDVETTLNELNLGICDYAITQFYDLIYGKYSKTPLTGDKAYEWDLQFITYEQGTVAPPIYKKASSDTIDRLQNMVDKDWLGQHGIGSSLFNGITPAFDDFDPPALITDNDFRIDLPLLMLYLDKHKPRKTTKSFAKHLVKSNDPKINGTVDESVKKIIRNYVR